ncbi:MAG: protein TolA, partial [Bacteroidetes bacterium]
RQAEEEAKRRIEAEKRQAEEEARRRIEAEKRQAEEEARRKAEAERQASILRMSDKGIAPELIAEFLGISLEEVQNCISGRKEGQPDGED